MDPLATAVASTVAKRLAAPVGRGVADRILGARDQRAIERACRAAVDRAVDEARASGLTADETTHLLGLLNAVVEEIGVPGVPLLPSAGRADPTALRAWRRAAAARGQDPATYPVGFSALVERVITLIPQEIAATAGEPDSPLFQRIVLAHLEHLTASLDTLSRAADGTRQARSMPLSAALRHALDDTRAACRAAVRMFVTPDLLLTLIQMPDRVAARCFDTVRPGLSSSLREQLTHYLDTAALDPFRPFDWVERADVQQAQRLAWTDGAPVVTVPYLLLGVLDSESTTRRQLAELLGAEFERLHETAMVCRIAAVPEGTPGYVFSDDDY
jgi:hypothetical protein